MPGNFILNSALNQRRQPHVTNNTDHERGWIDAEAWPLALLQSASFEREYIGSSVPCKEGILRHETENI